MFNFNLGREKPKPAENKEHGGIKKSLRSLLYLSLLATAGHAQGIPEKDSTEFKSFREYGEMINSLPKYDSITNKMEQDGGWMMVTENNVQRTGEMYTVTPDTVFEIAGVRGKFGFMTRKMYHAPTEQDPEKRNVVVHELLEADTTAGGQIKDWNNVFPTFQLDDPGDVAFEKQDIMGNPEAGTITINFFDPTVGKERSVLLKKETYDKGPIWKIVTIWDR